MTQCRYSICDFVPSVTGYIGVMYVVIDHDEETGTDYVSGLDQDLVMVVNVSLVGDHVVVIDRNGRTVHASPDAKSAIEFFVRMS